jgi:ring-1,2-phenylacetyl-CoA epoxidase subunit PaaE
VTSPEPAAVEYHPLSVAAVERLTTDAVAVTFDVPAEIADRFAYLPGQHVALRADIDGEDVRRTYSICANARTGKLRVGIKQVPGGEFSTFATTRLAPGDIIGVSPPYGEFTIEPEAGRARHYAAIAAGSGITPVLAMVSSVLATESGSRFTLLFGNRTAGSIMFREELAGLKDRYPARFQLVHVLSREAQLIPAFSGRLDPERINLLLDEIVDSESVAAWFLCGPYELVRDAREALRGRGVAAGTIQDELFFSAPTPPAPPPPPVDTSGHAAVTFTLDGRTATVLVDPAGPPILSYALEQRRDTPFSCRGGMCTTCKARVSEGRATLDRNFALTADDLEQGYILTCQAHPSSETLTITYDV